MILLLSPLVDLELQFYSFALSCFVGKLWWIGPLCTFSSLGTVSIAVRCSTCHYWASRFIHFLLTRLGVLITLLVFATSIIRTTVGSATSSSVDLDLQFFSFAPSCLVGKLWWIGPLCTFSSLGTVSIAVRCSTCHYWASRFIHFLLTRLGVLITLLVFATSIIRTTVGSATSSSVDLDLQFFSFAPSCLVGKLWWIGPLCTFSSLGTVSIAVRCSTCHYWASRFIHFLLTRLGVLITLLVFATSIIRTTVGSATSSSVDLDLQFFSFAPSCLVGKLWWIGPLCTFSSLGTVSIAVRCSTCHYWASRFIHFLLTRLCVLITLLVFATSIIWTTVGSATYQ